MSFQHRAPPYCTVVLLLFVAEMSRGACPRVGFLTSPHRAPAFLFQQPSPVSARQSHAQRRRKRAVEGLFSLASCIIPYHTYYHMVWYRMYHTYTNPSPAPPHATLPEMPSYPRLGYSMVLYVHISSHGPRKVLPALRDVPVRYHICSVRLMTSGPVLQRGCASTIGAPCLPLLSLARL